MTTAPGGAKVPGRAAILAWGLTLAVTCVPATLVARRDRAAAGAGFVAFSPTQRGCAIVVPSAPSAAEQRAAETLRATLAQASGRAEADFPILPERGAVPARAWFVGATRRGADWLRATARPPFDSAVGARVKAGSLFLRSEYAGAIEGAVGWFLERQLGVHWFMPGPLGEFIPRRTEFALGRWEEVMRPGFVCRTLLVAGDDGLQWAGRNRLVTRLNHGHAFDTIFRPEDFRRTPEMAPLRAGRRFIPAAEEGNWQPNLLSPAAVRHAAGVATRALSADPARLSFSLSANDGFRFDDSPATVAAAGPARYFRHRPDYSNLIFRFTNAVADLVRRDHPDRWLPAYAYYWSENVPDLRIAPNVVPFLTADRSQWSHPSFAAEDQALIERWCRSGAGLVGLYDYYYGAPFLSPRPTLYAVRESIPFSHRAGVRAFYAEASPNWALDGPKPWLAAQLLWSPDGDSAELLDTYYREFWGEAAAPMREFFALCERTWREQPGPPLWLRFFRDEDQAYIYPPETRSALRRRIDQARVAAQTEVVRARVEFVDAGFSVSEAFWDFAGARETASRRARSGTDPRDLMAEWRRYRAAREAFVRRYDDVRRDHPLAVAPQDLEHYLRNQPDSRIVREALRSPGGEAALEESTDLPWTYVGATRPEIAGVLARGEETLKDPNWEQVRIAPIGSPAAVDWTAPAEAWRGGGEPWEGRTVAWAATGGARTLRLAGCRTEGIGQWVVASPGAVYAAQVRVRARTSPGTATYLIVTFLDAKGRHLGLGRTDRLPPDSGIQETELCVVVRAPAEARHVGFGLRVLNQINDDFAEFSEASLRRLVE